MKTTPKSKKLFSKLLISYYGNPAKDIQLIVAPDPTLGALINEVLLAAGLRSSVILAPSLAKLHKSLSKTWKDGATHTVITTSSPELLTGLPIHIAIDLSLPTSHLVLNRDSSFFSTLQASPAKVITYGTHPAADTRVDRSKLYKKGTEASIAHGSEIIQVATFATGDSAVSYLAAATAVAKLLGIDSDIITDGLANYEPNPQEPIDIVKK